MTGSAKRALAAALLLAWPFLAASPARAHSLDLTLESFKLGDKVPFDEVEFVDGRKLGLKEHLGRDLVAFFFWSSYFKGNQNSLSFSGRLFKEFSGANVVFLCVSLDSDKKKARELPAASGMAAMSTYNPFLTFPSKLLGTIAPDAASLVVIDEKGTVAFLWTLANGDDFQQARKFFAEHSRRPKRAQERPAKEK